MQSISDSPSFNSYSSTDTDRLAEIAARVVQEYDQTDAAAQDDENKISEEDEFEFAFVSTQQSHHFSPADQIFYNGQIRPVYPLFNTNLLFDRHYQSQPDTINTTRLPLAKLLIEERERDTASSCSSSEADELDGVAAGTYCVWKPKSTRRCTKSGSTGTSKRWKFRHLLHRSNSDGRDSLVILAKKSVGKGKKEEEEVGGGNVENKKDVGVVGLFANNVNGV